MLTGTGLSALSLAFGGVCVLVTVFPRRRVATRGLGAILGGTGGLAALAAALYVMTQLPGAATQDLRPIAILTPFTGFWGSGSGSAPDMRATLAWSAEWA